NGDGLQNEPASNGTNGVKVYLLDGSGNKIDSTITANDGSGNPGYYNFPNLNSGNYQVQFPTVVGGFPLSSQTTTPQTDGNTDADASTGKSPIVTINTNSSNPLDVNNPTIDAGYGVLGSLGNYVWYDDNANGLQDEPASNGVNGVKVILYKETTPGSGVYAKYDSTTTSNDGGGNPGYYTFEDLFSANYKVQFPTSVNNFPITGVTNQAMQTDGNNDANRTTGFSGVVAIDVTLGGLNRDNPTIDAGYTPIGSLGNYVWYDANKNGLQDEPNTNGINDIKVILYKETAPGVYTKIDSTITANDGSGKLGSEGSYYLTPTNNQAPTTDGNNDANSLGFSGIVPLNPKAGGINKDNPTIDAGYYCDCNGFKVDIVMNKTSDCFAGNSFSFSANINRVGGKYTYSWDFGDGTTSTLANPTHSYAAAGEYDVKLTVTEDNFCGCRYEASVRQLYVGPKPVVAWDFQYNGNCLTYDFNSNSTVTMGWIAGFYWDFGNGTTSTQSNPLATFSTPGIYNVKLVVTTNYGCKDSLTIPVNIINKCNYIPCPTIGVINGATNLCVGGTTTVSDTTAGGTWASSNTSVATINGAGLITALSAGSTTISYTVVKACGTTVAYATVNVSSNSAQPIGGSDSVCVGQNIYLWNANSGGTYTASNGNATVNNSGNVLGVTAGNVTITYSVTTPCGTFTSTKVIKVSDACSVSSGGSGGVESKTLGDVIAVRLYGNAINSVLETNAYTSNNKFVQSGAIVNGTNDLTLNNLVPSTVANTDAAYVTTPTDLVNFTNAVEVLAVDYSKGNSTKAVAFGTKTLGNIYSHTKPICDRLKGAELQEVKNITVNGFSLMAYKVKQRTGETEYAINLSAGTAANRNSISLQSNWFTDSYQQDEKLYNFQLWAVSYEMVTAMAKDIISKLQANGAVNTVTNADLPKAYVSKGSRKGTDLTVTVNNNTAATSGYFELHEKANENAATTTRQVAFTVAANSATNVTIPVKDNYEGDVYVYLNNKLTDLVYLADGTWNLDYNKQTTTISKFDVVNESNLTTTSNEHKLFRNVNVTGTTKDYITIYKTMMGGGLEQNVANYKSIMFNANAIGAGKVQVTLVKKSITNWKEQYTYTLDLDGAKEYGINLNQFKSSKFNDVINANDIVAVNFSFSNSRGVSTTMNINLSKARFTSTTIATDVTANAINVYPNPSTGKFNVGFTSETAQPLVLKVVETATGKIVKTQFINATKGANQTAVQLDNITSTNGLYIVTLEGDNTKYNAAKLMVNKR
ncbi:MAG: PKD domain-containing protein, partial [Bacteroidetes bacterium]|nr:PKD domain-containing protein [Bacteroidota bacterium]